MTGFQHASNCKIYLCIYTASVRVPYLPGPLNQSWVPQHFTEISEQLAMAVIRNQHIPGRSPSAPHVLAVVRHVSILQWNLAHMPP